METICNDCLFCVRIFENAINEYGEIGCDCSKRNEHPLYDGIGDLIFPGETCELMCKFIPINMNFNKNERKLMPKICPFVECDNDIKSKMKSETQGIFSATFNSVKGSLAGGFYSATEETRNTYKKIIRNICIGEECIAFDEKIGCLRLCK